MFSEFDILYKQLEKDRYNKDKVKRLFFEQADFILPDGSSNLNFLRKILIISKMNVWFRLIDLQESAWKLVCLVKINRLASLKSLILQ